MSYKLKLELVLFLKKTIKILKIETKHRILETIG